VKRIPPSERVRKQSEELLQGKEQAEEQDEKELAKSREEKVMSLLLLAVKRIVQEAVEREQVEFLGRERYQHQAEGHGWRNGYEPVSSCCRGAW